MCLIHVQVAVPRLKADIDAAVDGGGGSWQRSPSLRAV
jgi:hypothetical protein